MDTDVMKNGVPPMEMVDAAKTMTPSNPTNADQTAKNIAPDPMEDSDAALITVPQKEIIKDPIVLPTVNKKETVVLMDTP
jgi:hypothetical protein